MAKNGISQHSFGKAELLVKICNINIYNAVPTTINEYIVIVQCTKVRHKIYEILIVYMPWHTSYH